MPSVNAVNDVVYFVVSAFWVILPAYLANSSPVYFTSKLKKLHPIDFNRRFPDGRPVLGKGKTFEGALAGILVGTVGGAVQVLLQKSFIEAYNLSYPMSVKLAFYLACGAIAGDMLGSFIKRRMGKKRGENVFLLDTLDFLMVSIVVARMIAGLDALTIAFLMFVTPFVHRGMNILAYRLGMKDVPW